MAKTVQVLGMIFLACSITTASAQQDSNQGAIPNPASVYCINHGGKDKIETSNNGGQFGMCIFSDGSQCEEWQFFRSKCNPGQTIPSPFSQTKEGIHPNDVKCMQGLQLIIKTKDGSPACVRPESATKLLKWGWADKTIPSAATPDLSSKSSNNQTNMTFHKEVYFMKPNSTTQIGVRYHATCDYPNMVNLTENLAVYNASNFEPLENPGLEVNVSLTSIGHKDGEAYDVVYTIITSPDAKGIYEIVLICASDMDIAVGLDSSQISPQDIPVTMMPLQHVWQMDLSTSM